MVQCSLLQLNVKLASEYIYPGFFTSLHFTAVLSKRISQLVHATHTLFTEGDLTMADICTAVNQ